MTHATLVQIQGIRIHRVATRPRREGKFIFVDGKKLQICGVTYGAFRPDEDGNEYHDLDRIERDFEQMAANGVNVVRIPHTMPPRALLDIAARHGLYVMVGLSAEQYAGYLIDRKGAPDVEELIRAKVRAVADHPAILCYALGNEIPAPMVRWIGRRRVERYLKRLHRAVKKEDPGALVTYVNYPTTEYLQLPFLDLVCFNVYLEDRERLDAYLARLQNIAGDRPLIMSEVGLDSMRNGEETQAQVLDWQVRTAFAAGCAGVFIFAWTDEWYRGGGDVDDWAFGLTDTERRPKPALATVRRAFAEAPFAADAEWPRISVVVCSHNGGRTVRDCLEGLKRLEYPDYEVIVVDDGSTDRTALIAAEYDVRLIRTPNLGLSHARNTGLNAATGEIVAYIDDDAYPDSHWLTYVAATFQTGKYVGVGGPNLPPPGDGPIADCVANAPGGPVHVLLTDCEAEHIPGCNMAFDKLKLQAIGGFDPQFRVAGDDVDVCWRLQQRGWTLGFSPAAMVWHHRRNSVRTYWKQQKGYGKAEALLEQKWPEKYNGIGHVTWGGRVYGKGLTQVLRLSRGRVYQGTWGTAPFQSLYQPGPGTLASLSLMPEWFLCVLTLVGISALGLLWPPLLLALPLLVLTAGASLAQALLSGWRASFASAPRRFGLLKLRLLTAGLHLVQPLARLTGRLRHGLSPWRRRGASGFTKPWTRSSALWTEDWIAPELRVEAIETALRREGVPVLRGGDFDTWDLEVRGGLHGAARLLMAIEDHGSGTQYVRLRIWPRLQPGWLLLALGLISLAAGAALATTWTAAAVLGSAGTLLAGRGVYECATAIASTADAAKQTGQTP
jgi:O-antigen biosynthesis protein